MYLVDDILGLKKTEMPASDALSDAPLRNLIQVADRIADGAIYAFEGSAAMAAADLRLDSPERIEALCRSLFRTPRRMILEVAEDDRSEMIRRMGWHTDVPTAARDTRTERVALLVDIVGDGRAQIEVVLGFRQPKRPGCISRNGRSTREPRDPMSAFAGPCFRLEIDMNRQWDKVSCADFEAAVHTETVTQLPRQSDARQFLIDATSKYMGKRKYIIDSGFLSYQVIECPEDPAVLRQVIRAAWVSHRLHGFCRTVQNPDAELVALAEGLRRKETVETVLDMYRRDLDGILPLTIAMLALLEVTTPDLSVTPRGAVPAADRGSRQRQERGRTGSADTVGVGRLSVVTMHLGDARTKRAYEASGPRGVRPGGAATGRRLPRHFVRGHLFLARNGEMVWRRAHWRGSAGVHAIARVVVAGSGPHTDVGRNADRRAA